MVQGSLVVFRERPSSKNFCFYNANPAMKSNMLPSPSAQRKNKKCIYKKNPPKEDPLSRLIITTTNIQIKRPIMSILLFWSSTTNFSLTSTCQNIAAEIVTSLAYCDPCDIPHGIEQNERVDEKQMNSVGVLTLL